MHIRVDQYCRVCGCSIEYYRMNLKYPISNIHNALMSFVFMTFCFERLTEHTVSTICYRNNIITYCFDSFCR